MPPESGRIAACPVLGSDECAVGVLLAVDARPERFDAWDEVGGPRARPAQAGAAIQRDRARDADGREPFERDLDVARQIQQALLPQCAPRCWRATTSPAGISPPTRPGATSSTSRSAAPARLAVALGDVSGHGSGPRWSRRRAARCSGRRWSQTDEPARVITEVNQLLCQDQLDDRFVTAFFGILRCETHRLDYVSAGQGPILFYSRGQRHDRRAGDPGVPARPLARPVVRPQRGSRVRPGDFLALVTDGFFEWFNDAGECFGIERTKAQLARDRDQPAAEIIRRLHASVLDFAGGSPQPDDLTAVVIKRVRDPA